MSGRRSHRRFAVLASPEGVLRVMRDVIIREGSQTETPEQLVIVSQQPGVLGETVLVRSPHEDDAVLTAQVLESQPIVVDGSIRHQLRLHHVSRSADND